MFNTCKALLQLALILTMVPISCIICIIFFPLLSAPQWAYVVKKWARLILLLNNVQLEVLGQKIASLEPNSMIIANHFAWLDVIVLYAISFINFIGKTEMQKWPIINILIRAGGTVFINREKKKDILKVNQIVGEVLKSGKCIGLFPEGQVTDGKNILPFKSSLFAAAILAQSKIIPIVLLYYHKDGRFAYSASYAKRNLWQNVNTILQLNGLRIKALILPSIQAAEFSSREELSQYVHQQIENAYQQR